MRLAYENMEDVLSDPARFAEAIRAVAQDAYQLRQSPCAAALQMLSRRIELLTSTLGERRGGPIGTWLDSLEREVRSTAVQQGGLSRSMCICA
jgi:hypothetical protein